MVGDDTLNQKKTTKIKGKKSNFGGKFHLLYKRNVPFRSVNCKETDAKEFTDKAVLRMGSFML